MSASSFITLEVQPGIVKTRSGEGSTGRWVDALNVRFRNGKPEKRAGFQQYCPTVLEGIARGMDAWNTNAGDPRYVIGTNTKLYGSVDGLDVIDITPLRYSKTIVNMLSTTAGKGSIVYTVPPSGSGTLGNNPFATTSGSPTVTVTHVAHGHVTGDRVFFAGSTALGGITPSGGYLITRTTDNAYTITHTANATSTSAGGGGAAVAYQWAALALGQIFRFYGNAHAGGSSIGGVFLEDEYEVVAVLDPTHFALWPTSDKGTLGSNPISTTNASPIVRVTDVAHGRVTGDAVYLSGATAAGGITLAGDYAIAVIDANTYSIVHGSNATSTATGGGSAVVYRYAKAATTTVADGGGSIDYLTPLSAPFAVTSGDATVTVTDPGNGASPGETVYISGSVSVGGLLLNGTHTVATTINADTYTIEASAPASATTTGGGTAVYIEYGLASGPVDRQSGLRPFGRGRFGMGYFGTARPSGNAASLYPRTWAIDAVGEDAIASPLAGSIYYWDMSKGGRAQRIPNAPTGLRYACMTEERHLHALGVNGDPLVLGWSDQNDINVWTPTPTNTANNSRRVREGSALVAMAPVANGLNLIWTDTACYIHQYTGGALIYNTRLDASDSGLIAPQAFVVTTLGAFWMSTGRFLMWNGATSPVPNAKDVEDWVFGQIPPDQMTKCFAHYDVVNNSIDFYFVPDGSTEPTAYVTLNLNDFSWANGIETRTTGASFNQGGQNPYRVGTDGIVYKHEIGVDANGVSAPSSLTLAPLELAKGNWVEVLGLDPDIRRQTGDMTLTVRTYDRNPANPVEDETETFGPGVEMVDFRIAGRRASLELSQDLIGGDWAIDTPQLEVKQSGRRR